MALAHFPPESTAGPFSSAVFDSVVAMPSVCPSWLQSESTAPELSPPDAGLATVHPIQPEITTSPGLDPRHQDPSFRHPSFQHPSFQHPSFQHPSFQVRDGVPVEHEQWATVLPFVPSQIAQAVQVPIVAPDDGPPVDFRPVWMAAAFFASSVCVYVSSAPAWIASEATLVSDSFLQRLASTSYQLFGPVTLTAVTGVAAVALLMAGAQRTR